MPRHPALALATTLLAAALGAQPALDALVPPSPGPASFVHDGGPVLDAAAVSRIDARIDSVRRATGGDVAVAILRDIGDRSASEVGVAIHRAWGVGRADSIGSARRDLGALLLIVPRELAPSGRGDCWITTGLGAEGELRDSDAGEICRQRVIPELRERRYEAAVAAGVAGIGEAFARTTAGLDAPEAVGGGQRRRGGGFVAAIIGGLVAAGAGLAGLGAWIARRRLRPRPCPRGHGPMTRLGEAEDDAHLAPGQRTEERVRSVDYDVWRCGECGEQLVLPYRRWSAHEKCRACGFRTVTSTSRTLRAATTATTGLVEVTLACAHCGRQDVSQHTTPRVTASSGGGGRSGGGGGRSFGGSGRTSGGGGGGRY